MRRLGIIPVQRDTGQGLVDTMVGEFSTSQRMALVIAPEGTRRAAGYWRAGFYRIARAAGVPIVFSFMDYEHKRAGVGPTLHPTGDMSADMDVVRAFYEGINGKYPANQGPIVLREESTAE
jgi:1-acyl-sn-glycerol-3-phosphate acyltransferase